MDESPGSWWQQQIERSEVVVSGSKHQPPSLLRTVLDPNLKPQWAWPAQGESAWPLPLSGVNVLKDIPPLGRTKQASEAHSCTTPPLPPPTARPPHLLCHLAGGRAHPRESLCVCVWGGSLTSPQGTSGAFPPVLFPSLSISAPPPQLRRVGLREGSSWTKITQQGEVTH